MKQIDKATFDHLISADLSERFFAVINQVKTIEVLAVTVGDDNCMTVEVKTLDTHEYEPNAAQSATGTSTYYRADDSAAVTSFIAKIMAETVIDFAV